MGTIRVGVSGWSYDGWRAAGVFPDDLPRSREHEWLAHRFGTLEANGTFYRLGSPAMFERWYRAAPADFAYAVKGSRFVTHDKKLADVEVPLANLFASGVLALDDKLGPFLWQLPERLHTDLDRLDAFLDLLPRRTSEAVALARRHDDRVTEPAYGPGAEHRLRHVLEVRHEADLTPALVTCLHRHGVALAVSDGADWPLVEQVTAGFVYVRLHGPGALYASPYGERRLRSWAERIRTWARGDEPSHARRISDRSPPPRAARDVYVYLDNDDGAHAPRDADVLRRLLDLA